MASLQERAKQVFLSAWDLAGAEREAHIESACGDDAELERRVRELLAAGGSANAAEISALGGPARAAGDDHAARLNRALEGRYEILEEAGRGGMAVVYRARDIRHERDVALKVLAPEIAAAVGPERFLREIRIAANLQHATILPLYDSGDVDGLLYYAMPFLEGQSLQERIRNKGPLPVEDALAIAREVADALDYAHAEGFVHRDLKPGNILFLNGRAMLADFGLATAFSGAEDQRLTQSGVVLGTPQYMSPEQAVGKDADTRSDLYSLGCVVYEMLAGDPPFSGANVQAVLARHVSDPVSPIRTVRPQLPRAVSPVDTRIAYQSTRTANAEIWIHDLSTGKDVQFTDDAATDVLPEWSPNGEEIAFLSDRYGVMNILVANSDGTGRPERLSDEEIHIPSKVWAVSLSLRWTPDGTSLGYVMADAQGPSLWTIDRHGPASTTRVYPGVLRFDWYRDRHRIVYTTMTEDGMELRAANLRTKAEVKLWAGPHSEMILAPGGDAVALVKSASHFNQSLFLLRLEPPTTEDGLPRPIGELEFITGGEGVWHVHNGGWSPDGNWIVYTQDTDDGDIYSLTLKEN